MKIIDAMTIFGNVLIRCVQRTTRVEFVLISVTASRVSEKGNFVGDPAGDPFKVSVVRWELCWCLFGPCFDNFVFLMGMLLGRIMFSFPKICFGGVVSVLEHSRVS